MDQPLRKPTNAREEMPEITTFIDSLRKTFGKEDIDQCVRRGLAARSIHGVPDLHVTASFGVAERNRDEDFDALLTRADQALYAAKNAGRDCVRVAGAAKLAPLRFAG